MSKLYELTNEFLQLLNMLEDEDEDEQCILDTLEGIDYEFEVKADGYAKIIKSIESDVKGLDAEIQRLTGRKKTFENRIKYLKNNLEMCMKATGKTKFTTDLFSFNIQKNGGKRKLTVDVDVSLIPEDFRIKQPDVVDGDKLREYMKTSGVGGDICEWAHLEPQSEGLRIK
jgi:hypothetical protein